jgi:hypothetical protein
MVKPPSPKVEITPLDNAFIDKSVWSQLTNAAKSCRGPVDVAVAYFSKGASELLPLSDKSRLVVDASEWTVRAGLTCPSDLLALLERGCQIYTVPNLHAKVYVFGTRAYIGSANASNCSANRLVEAMVNTNDRHVIASARAFVRSLCRDPLSPEMLKGLLKIYRPPKLPAGRGGARKEARRNRSQIAAFAPLRIVKLKTISWSDIDDEESERGRKVVDKLRHHEKHWTTEEFSWRGKCSIQRHERVLQLHEEDDGRVMVSPLATALHIRQYKVQGRDRAIVYLERRTGRRQSFEALAKRLGHSSERKLNKGGIVRDEAFASLLRSIWPQ